MGPLSPYELARRLAGLPVVVEAGSVELGSVPVPGYYGGRPRPSGLVSLAGAGHVGRGENVDWTPQEQDRFARVAEELVPRLAPRPATTVGALYAVLQAAVEHPHHRAAIEAAAIDLALRQAGTDLFELAARPPRPIRFCWSIGREEVERDGPLSAVDRLLDRSGDARVKLDCPRDGWPEAVWKALAGTRRVVIVDFKRDGSWGSVEAAHRHLPTAWLEDPPLEDPRESVRSRPRLDRVALDGYVTTAADLDDPPLPPAAVNVKAPRVGGVLEALGCFGRCARAGWATYVGGMFEVDAGRRQARVLASLFSADGWNDLAPPRGGRVQGELAPPRGPGFG